MSLSSNDEYVCQKRREWKKLKREEKKIHLRRSQKTLNAVPRKKYINICECICKEKKKKLFSSGMAAKAFFMEIRLCKKT